MSSAKHSRAWLDSVRERSQRVGICLLVVSHHVPYGSWVGVVLSVRQAARCGLAGLLRVRRLWGRE